MDIFQTIGNGEDYKQEIEAIASELSSTQNELEKTILENNDLKRQIKRNKLNYLKPFANLIGWYKVHVKVIKQK